jgi:thiol-disulfide isomerase/thioredoxin
MSAKYFKHFLVAGLFSMIQLHAHAQYHSDFKLVKGNNDSEVVYKGSLTFDDVKSVADFNLQKASEDYKTNEGAIKTLKEHLKDYDLVVFLGTWCEDSHRTIPQLYKVLQETAYPFEKLTLYGVDRQKKTVNDIQDKFNVKLVPSIIVLQQGKEIGRITEVVDRSVEQDLEKIIHP